MNPIGIVELFSGVSVLSLEPILFRDRHMRNAPDATNGQIPVATNALLMTHVGLRQDQVVLCDSGSGDHIPPKLRQDDKAPTDLLQRRLQTLGIPLENVDHYILGHGHWDHAGGAFPKQGGFIFSRATVIVSRGALDQMRREAATHPSFVKDIVQQLESLDSQGRLIILEVGSDSLVQGGVLCSKLGESVVFYASEGHAAQLHPAFQMPQGVVVHMGDLIPTAWHAQAPDRFMPQFDVETGRTLLLREKAAVLKRFSSPEQPRTALAYYHDNQTAASFIRRRGDGTYDIVEPWQFNL